MPSVELYTLRQCFEQNGSVFPFSVIWHIRDSNYNGAFLTFESVSDLGASVPSWIPDADTQDLYPDMEAHMGWATEPMYQLANTPVMETEEINVPNHRGIKLEIKEFSARITLKEWKQDQAYRKAIGNLVHLNKVGKNRYLEQAIVNAKQARASQAPAGRQVSYRQYVLTWKDSRFPQSYTGQVSEYADLPWYPVKGKTPDETKKLQESYNNSRRIEFKRMTSGLRLQIADIRRSARTAVETRRVFSSRVTGARLSYGVLSSIQSPRKNGFKFSKPEYEVVVPEGRGGVHPTSGAIEWLAFRKNGNALVERKTPSTNDKYVGIEIEFFSKADQDQLGLKLYRAGVAKFVQLKHDGSIRPEDKYPHGHEICVLAKESEYEEVLSKVCKVLEDAGSKVNKSCGMHVHLDMRSRNKETAFANLVSSQNILYAMNPASRLEEVNGQRYCAFTRSRRMDQQSNRYHGINGHHAYSTHKTIEVRIHAGTFQARKITNWVKLLIMIVNRPEAIARSCSTLGGFVKQFDLPLDLAEYIVERIKKFADKNPANQEEAA